MANDDHRTLTGAERAVRAADRMQRRMHRRGGFEGGPPVFFGVVFLMMGVLFLLDNLDLIDGRSFLGTFWPLLIVGWGLTRLLSGHCGRTIPTLAIAVGAVLLGNRLLGWDINVARLFWPIALIALGAHILYRSWHRPTTVHASGAVAGPGASFGDGDPVGTDAEIAEVSSSTFQDSALLGSVERRNVSQLFRGGTATAVMGSVEMDLRESRMAATEAVVDVSVVMGAVEFRIPRDWTVESRVSALLGSFEDMTEVPVDVSAKRFVVKGSVLLGSVEIRN